MNSRRLAYEHLFSPGGGVYITVPRFVVQFEIQGQPVAAFGFDAATVEELKDAILFRATQLLDVSWCDPLLSTCTAVLEGPDGDKEHFYYNEEKLTYDNLKN